MEVPRASGGSGFIRETTPVTVVRDASLWLNSLFQCAAIMPRLLLLLLGLVLFSDRSRSDYLPGFSSTLEGEQQADFADLLDDVLVFQQDLVAMRASGDRQETLAAQNSLGHALTRLGDLQSDGTILNEAIEVLREALWSFDEHEDPVFYAVTQQNLAYALVALGGVANSSDFLEESEGHYHQALSLFHEAGKSELAAATRRRFEPYFSPEQSPPPRIQPDDADEVFSDPDPDDDPGNGPPYPGFEVSLFGSIEVSAVTGRNEALEGSGTGHGYSLDVDPEVEIAANYQMDSGFFYGADVSFDVEELSGSSSVLHFSGGFGELRFGQDSGAEDDIFIGGGDSQAGSGGIDGNAANLVDVGLTGSGSAIKASYYTPRRRGVQVGVSFTPDTDADRSGRVAVEDLEDNTGRFRDHVGLGANWVASVMGADVIASVVGSFGQAVAGDNLSSYAVGGNAVLGRLSVSAGYAAETSFNDRDLLNFGVIYGFDPWIEGLGESRLGAGIAFLFPENAPDSTVFALSGDLEMAAGLRLLGDLAYNHREGPSPDGLGSSLSSVLAIELSY